MSTAAVAGGGDAPGGPRRTRREGRWPPVQPGSRTCAAPALVRGQQHRQTSVTGELGRRAPPDAHRGRAAVSTHLPRPVHTSAFPWTCLPETTPGLLSCFVINTQTHQETQGRSYHEAFLPLARHFGVKRRVFHYHVYQGYSGKGGSCLCQRPWHV